MAGLRFGLTREAALREEMVLLAVSIPLAPMVTLEPWKLLALWSVLLLLLCVELLNTGIEKVADRVTAEFDPLVKIAKDCGSAAVLVAILIAAPTWGVALWERLAS